MTVATYIAHFLKSRGVTHVFGFDGSMMLKIADEIALTDGIDYYQGFHEQGCAFMADAYARVTGNPGVVLVTSGPGAINVLAGCADAFMDSVPLFVLTGNDRLTHIAANPGVRLNGFQDLDIVSVAAPITKYAVQITDPGRLAYELEKAMYLATEGRKGPVLVDVPMDVQFWDVPEMQTHFVPEAKNSSDDVPRLVGRIADALSAAKRPVILAGGGIQLGAMPRELAELAKQTGIPVVTTLNGHDAFAGAVGTGGLYGHPEANLALWNADLLLAVGARFGQQQVGKAPEEYTRARIIHLDIDPKEIGRVFLHEERLCADGKPVLKALVKRLEDIKCLDFSPWRRQIQMWKTRYQDDLHITREGIDPLNFVRHIGEVCPEGTIYTNDVGQNTMWVCQGLPMSKEHRLLTSSGYASMGFSLPAAIGAKMAMPQRTVVSFSGDGGFQMNLQELQFVKLHGLNIKFVVFNNNTLGMMREVQKIYYNNHYVGSNTDEFTCVDLKKIADVYGLDYTAVFEESELDKMDSLLKSDRPAVLDCRLPIDTYLRNWNDFKKKHPEALVETYGG